MRVAGLDRCGWLRSRAKGVQPVRHVRKIFVYGICRAFSAVARQRQPSLLTLHRWIVLEIPFLFHQEPSRRPFGAEVHQRVFLTHETDETWSVVPEAR